jgi:hypothetical protein
MTPDPFFDRDLSRRAFLGGGLVVAGGLVTAASLGSPAFGASSANKLAPLVLSSDLYVSDQPQRLVVALARGGKRGIQFVSGPAAQFRFRAPTLPGGTAATATSWVKAPLDRAGLPKGRGVYVSSPLLDTAGVWKVEAKTQGETVPFAIQVNAAPIAPVVGQPAPRAASPTLTDTLGVSPICTRQPMCPLHTVSLASVIGAGKPVAALFATPARCQSQYCGPVLDEMLHVMDPFKDRVTFVHIEIYKSLTASDQAHVPTVDAWHLPSEPWLYGIDGAGVIRSRIDGAFGGDEMQALLTKLAG